MSGQSAGWPGRYLFIMRIVCISDTHGHHGNITVPAGDVLIHAGDLTDTGTEAELKEALRWFGCLPHRHKVFIAGNRDGLFERDPQAAAAMVPKGVHYLEDSGCEIRNQRAAVLGIARATVVLRPGLQS